MGQDEGHAINFKHLLSTAKVQEVNKVGGNLFTRKSRSRSGGVDIRTEHKRQSLGFISFHGISHNLYSSTVKRLSRMAETKMILMFADFIGVPLFTYVALLNIGTFKSDVLFAIAIMWGLVRLTFYIIKQIQDAKYRALRLKEKKHEVEHED